MELPNVKNVNNDNRELKKHHFKVNDMVAYKWYGGNLSCPFVV